ncbi:cobalt transporter subunit CbtA [Loktanella salsilacus]|uniref:Cobalt transporter subunit CbtA n=2 Tax=Loktanella salsilacus TaxID=195913 RepID=A0A1I4IS02_9RHOB|nr:cobalt transporter subunit CbtA [Loktanella salsilacus]
MQHTMYATRPAFPATNMLRPILTTALLAGAAAGATAGLLHLVFVQDILLSAETFETGSEQATSAVLTVRNALTIMIMVMLYCGYGLILVALMAFYGQTGDRIDARRGLLWGVAGFAVVILAPAFSLPAQLPGATETDLATRQIWWMIFVVSAALGIWLLAFGKTPGQWAAAVLVLVVPHLLGPQLPDILTGSAPMELAALFTARSLGVGLLTWLVLGSVAGAIWRREQAEPA